MTKEEFIEQIKKIRIAYNNPEFVSTKEQFNIWYDYFEPLKNDLAVKAVSECIRGCKKIPSIADIMEYYDEFEVEYKQKMHEIHMNFDVGSGGFPYKDDYRKAQQEAYQVFLDLTVGLAEDDIDKAVYYSAQLRSKSRRDFDAMESDPDIRKNFPTYIQYLQKLKDGLKHEP